MKATAAATLPLPPDETTCSIEIGSMISLYYCYLPASIPPNQLNPHANFHRETCTNLNLGGRVRVSEEGINGVLSGTEENLREYEARLRKELMLLVSHDETLDLNGDEDPTTEWLDIKYCHLRKDVPVEKQLFDTLSVKLTREVVSLVEPVADHKPKGRARCRQRRKQKRKEKQRLEKLLQNNSGEIDVGGGPDELKSGTNEVQKTPDSMIKQMESTKINGQGPEGSVVYSFSKATREVGTSLSIPDWEQQTPALHLSPQEWNEKLLQISREKHQISANLPKDPTHVAIEDHPPGEEAILLDTRNIYETRIGHFACPNLETFFPNTRKFSSLPNALNTDEAVKKLSGKQVFMYCTGGVRCERAGSYLRALSESNSGAWKDMEPPKGIYQLRGGIQKYLESYGAEEQPNLSKSKEAEEAPQNNTINCKNGDKPCLYRGKNFVFDPRRTDPIIGNGVTGDEAVTTSNAGRLSLVGQCIICSSPHDDYDNGHAPCEGKEARCCRCRVLVLVCDDCRQKVRCWGEQHLSSDGDSDEQMGAGTHKNDLFCGNGGAQCVDEGNVADKVSIAKF